MAENYAERRFRAIIWSVSMRTPVALALCLYLVGCTECESTSDCEDGFRCNTATNQCVMNPDVGSRVGSPLDFGMTMPPDMGDSGMMMTPPDMGDSGMVMTPPDMGDSGMVMTPPDMGDGGVPFDGGMNTMPGPDRYEVVAGQYFVARNTQQFEPRAVLQDRVQFAAYTIIDTAYMVPGGSCRLYGETLAAGQPLPVYVPRVEFRGENPDDLRTITSDNNDGVYSAAMSFPGPFFGAIAPVSIRWPDPTGAFPPPAFQALPWERLDGPVSPMGLVPLPGSPVSVTQAAFAWVPVLEVPVVFVAARTEDGSLALTCRINNLDPGFSAPFRFPAMGIMDFEMARGGRAANVFVYRQTERMVTVPRTDGATSSVRLAVENGARYPLR